MSLLESVSSDSMEFNVRKFVKLFFDVASEREEDHNLEEEEDNDLEEKNKFCRSWLDFNNITGLFIACKDKSFIIDRIDKLNALAYDSNKQDKDNEADGDSDDDEEMLKFFSKNLITLDFEIKFVKLLNDKYIICGDSKVYIESYDPNEKLNLTSLTAKPISIDDNFNGSITDLKVHVNTNKVFILTSENTLFSLDLSSSSYSFKLLFDDVTKDQISCFDFSDNDLLVGHTNNNSITKLTLNTFAEVSFEVKEVDSRMHPVDLISLDNCKLIITFDISGKADTTDAFEKLELDLPRYSSYFVDANSGTSQLIDEEFCSNSDINRDFKFYFVNLKKWINGSKNDLFIVTSTVAGYLSPISSKTLYLAIEDEQKASMPLDPDSYDDLFISGISVDLLNSTEASVKRMESAIDSDLYPVIWILSSSGILTSFDFYDIDSIKKELENIRNSTQLNILKKASPLISEAFSLGASNSIASSGYGPSLNSTKTNTEKHNPFSSAKSSDAPSIFSGSNAFASKNSLDTTASNASTESPKNSTATSSFGKSSLGQSESGQSKSGQSGFGQLGFGQSGSGKSGFGQSGFGQSGSGKSSFGQSGFGQSGFGQSGFGQSGFGQSGFGQSGFGSSGFGQSGLGQSRDAFQKNSITTGNSSTGFNSFGKSVDGIPSITNLSIGNKTNVFGNNTSRESPFASLNKNNEEKNTNVFGNNSSRESPFASLNKNNEEKNTNVFGNSSSRESPFASLNKNNEEKNTNVFGNNSSRKSPFGSLNKDDKEEIKTNVLRDSSSRTSPFASLDKDNEEKNTNVFGDSSSRKSPFGSLNKDDKEEIKTNVFGDSSSRKSPFGSLNKGNKEEIKTNIFGDNSSRTSPFASLVKDNEEKNRNVFGDSSSRESPLALLDKDNKEESKTDLIGNPSFSKPEVIKKDFSIREDENIQSVEKDDRFGKNIVTNEEAFIVNRDSNEISKDESISQNKPTQYYLKEIKFPTEYFQKNEVEKSLDRVYYETLAEHRVFLKNLEDMELFKKNHSPLTDDIEVENSSEETMDKYAWKLGDAKKLGTKIDGISVDISKFKDLNSNIGKFNSNEMSSLQTNYDAFVKDLQNIAANQIIIKKASKDVQLPYEFEMLTKKLNSKVNHTLKLFEILETKLLKLKSKYSISYAEDEAVSSKLQLVTNQIEDTLKRQMQEITILIKEVYQIRNFKQTSNPMIEESIENEDSFATDNIEDSSLVDGVSRDLLRLEVSEANLRYMKRKSLINYVKKSVNLQN